MVLLALAAGYWGWRGQATTGDAPVVLYGHVDIRQVSLAFEYSGRVTHMQAEEGQHVRAGEILAQIDTRADTLQLNKVEVDIERTQAQYRRLSGTATRTGGAGVSAIDIDNARALWRSAQAESKILQHRIAQAQLKAPHDGVIRSRLLEPGDMASAQRPAYTLTLIHPKWIRAYVSEPQLTRVRAGMAALVYADGMGDQAISGHVGFMSSVAEFTPKAVQTEDLRPHLVYELRVIVEDPQDQLRQGMPVTVRIAQPASPEQHS